MNPKVVLNHFVISLAPIYCIVAVEEHKDGTPHLHAVLVSANKFDIKTHSRLDLIDEKDEMEYHGNYQCSRNPEDTINYCKKGNLWFEYGTYETKRDKKKLEIQARNKLYLTTPIQKLIDDGELHLMQLEKVKRGIDIYKGSKKGVHTYLPKECLWVYGAAGTGKSAWIRLRVPADDLYYKQLNMWWDNYEGQKYVLLDDFDHSSAKTLSNYLKIWADNYVFSGECKGGSKVLDYTTLYLTSNYLPHELWKDDKEMQQAICRRFKFKIARINLEDEELDGKFSVDLEDYSYF